jgi:hypothetical protein
LLLRASSEIAGDEVDVRALTDPKAPSGVAHGVPLLAFADALVGEDDTALESAREALVAAIGSEGLVDAAAVASNFERMVRIADGTGIPLDAPVRLVAAGLPDEIEISSFASAANTPAPTFAQRTLSRAVQPFAYAILRRVFRRARV